MQYRSGGELRELFLSYFEEKGSRRYPSFSLRPEDPTILFTIAGMVPFKPFFLGIRTPEVKRATTSQKCVRTNDIDNVGRTARHHTFFEMLGNFSFGDYFKKDAIPWAWEFLTARVGLEPDRLYATVYLDDDEAADLWHQSVGLSKDRIVRLGADDNFWAVGPVGPCGPCSEILYDQGPAFSCGKPECAPGCSCDRYLEIWNLVFMQFNRNEAGELIPLPKKNIDTGMGLERLSSVVQRVRTDFETDLFSPLIGAAASLTGVTYGASPRETLALRVIADHLRAVSFMIADGILPANEGRGYVLRRLLRRAVRFGRLLGIQRPFLGDLLPVLVEQMGGLYGELIANRSAVEQVMDLEERRFGRTLEQGCTLLEEAMGALGSERVLSGEVAFELYDTFGFPPELTREICEEQQVTLDLQGFKDAMELQRGRARASSKQRSSTLQGNIYTEMLNEFGKTPFLGYTQESAETSVLALLREGERVEEANEGDEVEIVLAETPFYAERGGQLGDTGEIRNTGVSVLVTNTTYGAGDLVVHRGRVHSGALSVGSSVSAVVDTSRRWAIRRHHSATHLLHEALVRRLGSHVRQAGSLVTPELLRFDFTHFEALRGEDLEAIELFVNEEIVKNTPVTVEVTTLDKAREKGAKALFDEKYGEEVRLVSMPGTCAELCGGTHVGATGDIGAVKILREEGIGAGVRRITALAGIPALRHHQELFRSVQCLRNLLNVDVEALPVRVGELQEELHALSRALGEARLKGLLAAVPSLIEGKIAVGPLQVVTGAFDNAEADLLLQIGDRIKQSLSGVVVVLAGCFADRVQFVAMADAEAQARGAHAGRIVKETVAITGGGGGGKADLAQAGGRQVSRTRQALEAVPGVVKALLGK